MPDYGRNVPYPSHPSVLDRFVVLLRKIHLNWRAKMMVKSLSPEQQGIMRKKIAMKDTFSGKKPWNPSCKLVGDTLSSDPENGHKFKESISKIMATGTDKNIIYAGVLSKVNRKGKNQVRTVVVTEKVISFFFFFFSFFFFFFCFFFFLFFFFFFFFFFFVFLFFFVFFVFFCFVFCFLFYVVCFMFCFLLFVLCCCCCFAI